MHQQGHDILRCGEGRRCREAIIGTDHPAIDGAWLSHSPRDRLAPSNCGNGAHGNSDTGSDGDDDGGGDGGDNTARAADTPWHSPSRPTAEATPEPVYAALGRVLTSQNNKKALLFKKRSKNFREAVADYPATAAQKVFWFFFSKKNCFLKT
jgi:hypothetical protein